MKSNSVLLKHALLAFVLAATLTQAHAAGTMTATVAAPETAKTPAQRDARMAWWRDARFGLFVHWGPVSLKGTEISWSRANSNPMCPNKGSIPVEVYDNLYKEFNPVKFNPDEWMSLASQAGMRYAVLTVKHCDGFLLWPSKTSGYNISATPFRRDVSAEFAKAVRRHKMRLGWYFSPMDWKDPDFRTERNAEFVKRMQGQLSELLTNYGKVDVLWFDYDGREPMYDQATTYPLVKRLQPEILITNRLDLGKGNNNRQILSPYADFYTPEQNIGGYDDQRPWETCMTLGKQWAWKPNDKIKTVQEVVGILARCVGGDGNLLLNVGPMPDGSIEPRQVEVLKSLAAWMKVHGESIHGTRGGPFKPGDYGASTRKGNTIFVHVLKWPQSGPLVLPAIEAKVVGSRILSGGKAKLRQTERGLEIEVPVSARNANDTVVALELDKPASSIPAIAVPKLPEKS